mmetsp:Transcript_3389/g.6412  ORF Transcript_3389/g.6412 Transcript_3389/m.6412 type:complete len:230 (-) Transcript_3389:659-1348(-)
MENDAQKEFMMRKLNYVSDIDGTACDACRRPCKGSDTLTAKEGLPGTFFCVECSLLDIDLLQQRISENPDYDVDDGFDDTPYRSMNYRDFPAPSVVPNDPIKPKTILEHSAKADCKDQKENKSPEEKGLNLREDRVDEEKIGDILDVEYLCATCELTAEQAGKKKLLRCGQCRSVHYCSKLCQQKHWPSHKLKCKQLQVSSNSQLSNNPLRDVIGDLGHWQTRECRSEK